MNLIADHIGLQIKYINGPSWNQFLDMMKTNELDVMLNIVKTEAREMFLNYTSPYSIVTPVIAVPLNSPDYYSLNDLNGKTLCIPKGSSSHEYLSTNYPKIILETLVDAQDCLNALSKGTVDVSLDGDVIINKLIADNNFTNIKISKIPVDPAMASILRLATSKSNTILRDILQKAVDSVPENKISHLKQKWFAIDKPPKSIKPVNQLLNFTKQEQQWINNNTSIKVASELDWPPFDFVENGLARGYSIDLIRLIGQKSGLEIEFVNGHNWKKLMALFKEHKIDVLPAVFRNPEREQFSLFTPAYFENRSVIVTKDDNFEISNIGDLFNKKVAIVSGYTYEKIIQHNYPNIKIVVWIPLRLWFKCIFNVSII